MGGTTAIRNLWQTIKTFTINKILQKLNSYPPEWNCKGGKVILDPRVSPEAATRVVLKNFAKFIAKYSFA